MGSALRPGRCMVANYCSSLPHIYIDKNVRDLERMFFIIIIFRSNDGVRLLKGSRDQSVGHEMTAAHCQPCARKSGHI